MGSIGGLQPRDELAAAMPGFNVTQDFASEEIDSTQQRQHPMPDVHIVALERRVLPGTGRSGDAVCST